MCDAVLHQRPAARWGGTIALLTWRSAQQTQLCQQRIRKRINAQSNFHPAQQPTRCPSMRPAGVLVWSVRPQLLQLWCVVGGGEGVTLRPFATMRQGKVANEAVVLYLWLKACRGVRQRSTLLVSRLLFVRARQRPGNTTQLEQARGTVRWAAASVQHHPIVFAQVRPGRGPGHAACPPPPRVPLALWGATMPAAAAGQMRRCHGAATRAACGARTQFQGIRPCCPCDPCPACGMRGAHVSFLGHSLYTASSCCCAPRANGASTPHCGGRRGGCRASCSCNLKT